MLVRKQDALPPLLSTGQIQEIVPTRFLLSTSPISRGQLVKMLTSTWLLYCANQGDLTHFDQIMLTNTF